jgi:HK97 family phage prohead protease
LRADLVARPNPVSTRADLLEACYSALLVSGNAYLEAVSVSGVIRELHVLRADRTKVIPGPDGWPEGYEDTANGESVRFVADVMEGVRPILHLKFFHPANDPYGLSPLEAAAIAPTAASPSYRHPSSAPGSHHVSAPTTPLRLAPDGAFEGYASLFNVPDLGRDVVLPGAFRDSLRRRGSRGIKMLFQHDPAEPIGVWTDLVEDERGLYARGRLTTQVVRASEILALVRAGALDGLSIGFRATTARREARSGLRHLSRIDLWEISIVTFPLLPLARIARVKARGPRDLVTTINDATRFLRAAL